MEDSATVSGREKCSLNKKFGVVVTCEHGGNIVPQGFVSLFRGQRRMLRSHRGYDAGALELANFVSEGFGTVPHSSTVTRLLVDLNRSPENPRRFSEISRRLPASGKKSVMDTYYWPYRSEIQSEIGRLVRGGENVLHLSVHTFTPVLDGKKRFADIGLLYNPQRRLESLFCRRWKRQLGQVAPPLRVRLNYPYSGQSDGFTTYLRCFFDEQVYWGIELEVNQRFALGRAERWIQVKRAIVNSLILTLEEFKV